MTLLSAFGFVRSWFHKPQPDQGLDLSATIESLLQKHKDAAAQADSLRIRYEIALDHQTSLLRLLGMRDRWSLTKNGSVMLDMKSVLREYAALTERPPVVLWCWVRDASMEQPVGILDFVADMEGMWSTVELTQDTIDYHHRRGCKIKTVELVTTAIHATI